MIDLERAPERKVKRPNANSLERIGKDLVALVAEALAPKHQANPGQQSQRDFPRRTDPAIVKGVLDEVRDTNQDCKNADPVEPEFSNRAFQIVGTALGSSRKGWGL